jgi:hypothetical protein
MKEQCKQDLSRNSQWFIARVLWGQKQSDEEFRCITHKAVSSNNGFWKRMKSETFLVFISGDS